MISATPTPAHALPDLLADGVVATAPGAPVVKVDGLTKSFPDHRNWMEMIRRPFQRADHATVVNGVSFEVGTAEFFGLLGANGAGKTTLFKMLSTQLLPDAGSATVSGFDVAQSPRDVRRVLTPVVADERSLYWRLSARENLELFGTLYDIGRSELAARVREVLETVELDDVGTKMVGTFSSGMKQRLLIARALLARPKVLLLDEPTRSLDPVSARRFRHFLKSEIAGRQQCTVLLATHNAEEAFELCDRVAVLERGTVLAAGPVQDLMLAVSDDRYRIEVRSSQVDVARRVAEASSGDVQILDDAPASGWVHLELTVSDGRDGAASLLAELCRSGIDVSDFERVGLTLADLLERVSDRRANERSACVV